MTLKDDYSFHHRVSNQPFKEKNSFKGDIYYLQKFSLYPRLHPLFGKKNST
jgi:hypothetical protein